MESLPFTELTPTPSFQKKQRIFFSHLAAHVKTGLALHRQQGLWDRNSSNERDWRNVSGHCLVEAARVGIFADILGLDNALKEDMVLAASVHDFYKKAEITKLRANNTSWEAYAEAQEEAKTIMKAAHFSERVIRFASAVGHESVPEAERLVSSAELSPDEIAWLVAHYVDDYTYDDRWAKPVEIENGVQINDLDRRMQTVLANSQPGGKYHGISQAGIDHFGEPTYVAQTRVGKLVEDRLFNLVAERHEAQLMIPGSEFLPETIDQLLAEQISQIAA